MNKYNEFIVFAEKNGYIFNEKEKEFFRIYFSKKAVKFPYTFGNKLYFKIILDFYKEQNIYIDTFNPRMV